MSSRRYNGSRYHLPGKAIILSDPHFFHNAILKYDARTQFMTPVDFATYEASKFSKLSGIKVEGDRDPRISDESTSRMNEFILDAINAEVDDPGRDTVLILGDLVFGNSVAQYRRHAEYVRSRISCRDVRMIWGNHDEPDEIHDLFTDCYDTALMHIERQPCFLSHYPLTAWCGPPDTILLHGHVHGLYHDANYPHTMASPHLLLSRSQDVGSNTNFYKPYTMPLIHRRLKTVREKLAMAAITPSAAPEARDEVDRSVRSPA